MMGRLRTRIIFCIGFSLLVVSVQANANANANASTDLNATDCHNDCPASSLSRPSTDKVVAPQPRVAVGTTATGAPHMGTPIIKVANKMDTVAKTEASPAKEDPSQVVTKVPEAKKLYELYLKTHIRTIEAVQCLKDAKCIKPEDEVLKYSVIDVKLLKKLESLAANNDLLAKYYRGLIAYEQGLDYKDRASYIRDRDFITTAGILNKNADTQFKLAKKYFQDPAVARNPDACMYLGDIYTKGYGLKANKEAAMSNYYCAALEYLKKDQQLEAQIILRKMTEVGDPVDARSVEIYAKIHRKEK